MMKMIMSMLMICVVLLAIVHSSWAAYTVSYVPTAACESDTDDITISHLTLFHNSTHFTFYPSLHSPVTPSLRPPFLTNFTLGCDFLGPIWSPHPPTATDDVIVTSDVPLTMFASNNSNIQVNSLTFSNTTHVTFTLTNSVLFANASLTWQSVTNSTLVLVNSSLLGGAATGDKLSIVNGYVNVFFIEMNNAVFVDSNITCQLGYYSVVSLINNTYLATSQFTNDQLYSYGSIFVIQNLFSISNYAYIGYGAVSAYNLLFASEGTQVYFDNTVADFAMANLYVSSLLSFTSTDTSKTLTVEFLSFFISNNNSVIYLGDNVSAYIQGANINNLTLGNSVSLNFNGQPSDSSNNVHIYNIQQNVPNSSVNIETSSMLSFGTTSPIFNANINVLQNGSLAFYNNITHLEGNVTGGGTLQLDQNAFSSDIISVDNVVAYNGELTAKQVHTQCVKLSGNITRMNADVMVQSCGVVLSSSSSLWVTGNYMQTGGFLNITMFADSALSTTPYLLVNGSVNMSNVTVVVNLLGFIEHGKSVKWPLVRSLSQSLNATDVTLMFKFSNSDTDSLRLTTLGGDLLLERPATAKASFFTYLRNHLLPVILIVAAVVLIISFVIVVLVIRRKNQNHYQQIK